MSNPPVRLVRSPLLLGIAGLLLSGCGSASRTETDHAAADAVLWRADPPPAAPTCPAHAPALRSDTDLSIDVRTYRLPAGTTLPAYLRAHPDGVIVPRAHVAALLGNTIGGHLRFTLRDGQTDGVRFVNEYAFIEDYGTAAGFPEPQIQQVPIGSALSVQASVAPTGVRIDALRARQLLLQGVQTWVGTLPTPTGIRSYPWEEPTMLASEMDLKGPPAVLGPRDALIIPAEYWVERPSPQVRGHALDVHGPAQDARVAVDGESVLVVTGVVVTPAPDARPTHGHPSVGPAMDIDDPVRELTPPWRRAALPSPAGGAAAAALRVEGGDAQRPSAHPVDRG